MSDKPRHGVIRPLPNQPTSVKAFTGMLVEHADEIERIGCVIQWKDGSTNTASTEMSLGDRVWLHWVFNDQFLDRETIDDGE